MTSSEQAMHDEKGQSDQARGTCPIIGLSGGIGSGKSTVAELLARFGCVVTHSDLDGRAALRDPEIRDTIVEWWGSGVLDSEGQVDRSAVAAIVFTNPAERARLEALTHPWIEQRRREQWRSAPPDTPAVASPPMP